MFKLKKYYSIIIFPIVIFLLIFGCQDKGNTPQEIQAPQLFERTQPQIETREIAKWYEVYFSHVYNSNPESAKQDPNNIDKMLIDKIKSAQKTIDASLHELDSEPIANALIDAHQKGVKVRLITETDYMDEYSVLELQKAGITVKNDGSRGGLMHNKFLVFDEEAVWTGSLNTTNNGCYKNNNNAIYIRSKELADNFTTEFNEMFEYSKFGAKSPKTIPYPIVKIDSTEIITLFSPENDVDEAIISQINQAQGSIYFMIFSFTHDGIGNAMIEKYKVGVDVKGVFEKRGSETNYAEYTKMRDIGIPVKQDTNKWILHHKVIIIDQNTVITGSFNFSKNATKTNEENVLIIKGNPNIAKSYLAEFARVYGQGAPDITVPPEIRAPAETTTKININTATVSELTQLPGIGETIAQRIIEYRQTHGKFQKLDDITLVKGIGQKTFDKIKNNISL